MDPDFMTRYLPEHGASRETGHGEPAREPDLSDPSIAEPGADLDDAQESTAEHTRRPRCWRRTSTPRSAPTRRSLAPSRRGRAPVRCSPAASTPTAGRTASGADTPVPSRPLRPPRPPSRRPLTQTARPSPSTRPPAGRRHRGEVTEASAAGVGAARRFRAADSGPQPAAPPSAGRPMPATAYGRTAERPPNAGPPGRRCPTRATAAPQRAGVGRLGAHPRVRPLESRSRRGAPASRRAGQVTHPAARNGLAQSGFTSAPGTW